MNHDKEVFFHKYCCSCEHMKEEDNELVCDRCLSNPSNVNSHKPVYYKCDEEAIKSIEKNNNRSRL